MNTQPCYRYTTLKLQFLRISQVCEDTFLCDFKIFRIKIIGLVVITRSEKSHKELNTDFGVSSVKKIESEKELNERTKIISSEYKRSSEIEDAVRLRYNLRYSMRG